MRYGLDPAGRRGAFANGVDVITAGCHDGAPAQQWRLDERGLLRLRTRTGGGMDGRDVLRGAKRLQRLGGGRRGQPVLSTDAAGTVPVPRRPCRRRRTVAAGPPPHRQPEVPEPDE